MRALRVLLSCLMLLAILGCGGMDVKRVDSETQTDLSGRWNDTDSRLVSEAMIADCLGHPWKKKFNQSHEGKAPVVVVGAVRNRSQEHISVQTFIKDMERALINSGEIEFVAGSGKREEVRQERSDQAMYAKEETAKQHGMEEGADFMLQGSINAILDKDGGKSVMAYQIDLELINIETNKIVWSGQKKIKKIISQSRFGL